MKSLKEIRDYQESEYVKIKDLSRKIHHKLLSRLSFHELMDDNFDAIGIEDKYNKTIRPLIVEYKKNLREMINDHLVKFIEGWAFVHPEGRWGIWKEDGNICSVTDYSIVDNFNDYIFDLEIDEYCQLVYDMLDDYKIQPFWQQSYTLYGDGYRKYISSANNAEYYIKNNRNQFKGYKANYEVLAELAEHTNSLPYKMNLPPMPNDVCSSLRSNELQDCVKHHRVLHAFFEKYGDDPKAGAYYSSDHKDGTITFCRSDIDL